jgi:DNA repair protein RadC
MKYILYQVDDDFNVINKFSFQEASMTYEYINKHISEEPNVNFLLLKMDNKNDIESVSTYRAGKGEKILY